MCLSKEETGKEDNLVGDLAVLMASMENFIKFAQRELPLKG